MQAVSILQEEIEKTRCVVYVATSPIHERGVFAGQYIRKGTYVGTYEGVDDGDVTRSNERYVIYNYDEEDPAAEPTGWRVGTNEFRFLNHFDDPNLEMDENYHFWAARTIKKDEELTWYYGEEFAERVSKKRRRRRGVDS
jgi:SET domain-containing protein